MKILIGEDDIFTAEHLKDILLSFEEYVIEMAHSKEKIIQKVDSFKPDVALLDIRMKNKYDGIDVGEYIFNNYNFPIIYITAHSNEQIIEKALETEPSSYILKPFQSFEVKTALRIALNRHLKKNDDNFIMVKYRNKKIKILHSKILYFKSDNMYVEVHSTKGKYLLRTTLSNLFAEFKESNFIRIHQSYVINTNYIEEFTSKKVKIKELWIPISRKYKKSHFFLQK